MIIYAFPGMIAFIWLFKFPESPKYLLSQGNDKEALEVVQWMLRINKGEGYHGNKAIVGLKSEVDANAEEKHTGW